MWKFSEKYLSAIWHGVCLNIFPEHMIFFLSLVRQLPAFRQYGGSCSSAMCITISLRKISISSGENGVVSSRIFLAQTDNHLSNHSIVKTLRNTERINEKRHKILFSLFTRLPKWRVTFLGSILVHTHSRPARCLVSALALMGFMCDLASLRRKKSRKRSVVDSTELYVRRRTRSSLRARSILLLPFLLAIPEKWSDVAKVKRLFGSPSLLRPSGFDWVASRDHIHTHSHTQRFA